MRLRVRIEQVVLLGGVLITVACSYLSFPAVFYALILLWAFWGAKYY